MNRFTPKVYEGGRKGPVYQKRDTSKIPQDTDSMTDNFRTELISNLAAIEERMDRRIDRIEQAEARRADDYRREIGLRDDQIRRELDLRKASLDAEQAIRDAALDSRLVGFLSAQEAREQHYLTLANDIKSLAKQASDAATEAATVKSNYWAAVGVQILAVVAILVAAYFANQGNTLMVAQTTLAAFTSGKDSAAKEAPVAPHSPSPSAAPAAKPGT